MTIYALSTGPGISGIAVIRVSGKNTAEIVRKMTGSKLPTPRVATLAKFSKNGGKELIDEGVIIWFPAPNSYTGEDLAEFHVHGSRAVIKAMHLAIAKVKKLPSSRGRRVYQTCISKWKNKFVKSGKYSRSRFIRNRNTKKTSTQNYEWEIIR